MTMTMPSRDFLVGQAVRNYLALDWPATLRLNGVVAAAKAAEARITRSALNGPVRRRVAAEYRKLVAQYGEAVS